MVDVGQQRTRFVRSALASKGIVGAAQDDVAHKLQKANVASVELLKELSTAELEKAGISVGAARAIHDALWQMHHDEDAEKIDKQLKLRRENSTKREMKQKRL